MKKLLSALIIALGLMTVSPAQAQIKWGVKGGLNLTEMNVGGGYDKFVSNKNGFFIGPAAKLTLPIVGLGVDAALLYDQREAELAEEKMSQKSIVIPINLRYTIGLSSLASVHFAAGPQFGYNIGGKTISFGDDSKYELSKSNLSINLGVGATVFSRVEVGVTYNIACGKTGEFNAWDELGNQIANKNGRANAWQIHAAIWL